jgi:hypothetical protein
VNQTGSRGAQGCGKLSGALNSTRDGSVVVAFAGGAKVLGGGEGKKKKDDDRL